MRKPPELLDGKVTCESAHVQPGPGLLTRSATSTIIASKARSCGTVTRQFVQGRQPLVSRSPQCLLGNLMGRWGAHGLSTLCMASACLADSEWWGLGLVYGCCGAANQRAQHGTTSTATGEASGNNSSSLVPEEVHFSPTLLLCHLESINREPARPANRKLTVATAAHIRWLRLASKRAGLQLPVRFQHDHHEKQPARPVLQGFLACTSFSGETNGFLAR